MRQDGQQAPVTAPVTSDRLGHALRPLGGDDWTLAQRYACAGWKGGSDDYRFGFDAKGLGHNPERAGLPREIAGMTAGTKGEVLAAYPFQSI